MLSIHNVSKIIQKRVVLKDVSIALKKGEAVGLLGPNGAGKTTCFSIITGIILPDSGYVYLNDQDITELPIYKRSQLGIGYLPQDSSVFRGMTVEENIESVLQLIYTDVDEREARLEKLLNHFALSHLRAVSASSLSGGERRRVEIARALANNPQYILLDEPFAGIDPIAISDIRDLISVLKESGIGVLITDHNVRETLKIVDYAYILSNGRVLAVGTPSEIVEHEDVRRIYLGDQFTL